MKREFKFFQPSDLLQAAKLTEKCDCALVHGYMLSFLESSRQLTKSQLMPILTTLANSKFGCPTATFLMIDLGESSYEKRN
jgi:hypothetical protein